MTFKPTGTSQALIKSIQEYRLYPASILDLGCGNGVVGNSLAWGRDDLDVCFSDISQETIDDIKARNIYVDARSGSLFEPWKDMKFGYIIDDVSGVSEDIARVSPWFDGVPCDSGIDGTKLICKVLEEAPKYLEPDGKLFFPIVSLSNEQKILDTAQENFTDVVLLSHNEFPLPKEMYKHLDLLEKYKTLGYINYKTNFGITIFWTDIYVAY